MKKIHYLLIVFVCIFLGLFLTSCNNKMMDCPINIQIDEDNNLIWDKVSDARSYEIKFSYLDEDTTDIVSTRKCIYSLDELKEGDYKISVSSVSASEKIKNSNFSEELEYHKYYETGCVYTLINNNTEYEITKVGKAKGTFEIEAYYHNKAVTQIAPAAFKGSAKVEGISISANIETIGDNAFYSCSKLKKIVLPETVREIGTAVFQNCKELVSFKVPSSLIELPDYTFAYCRGLESVELPETLERIGESCFQDCSSLKSVTLPNSLKELGNDAFNDCIVLEKVTLGKNLVEIPDSAFSSCKALKTIEFSDEGNLKVIGNNAFRYCSELEFIELPEGLEDIGICAFNEDTKLNEVHIPDTVNHVGQAAFGLTEIYINQAKNNSQFIYVDKWLVGFTKNDELVAITASMFRNDTIGIADTVFENFDKLQQVATPKSLKYIGNQAFNGCVSLWKYTSLENSLISIGDRAFANCQLTNVTLGTGLESIGNYAFLGNKELNNNTLSPYTLIPETVNHIGSYAFYGTKLYTEPRNGGKIIYAGNWVVGYTDDSLGSITLEFDDNRVAGIADQAFRGAKSLTSITGLSKCKYIGTGAFYECESLATVSLNRNLKEIAPYTFYGCISLVKVSFPRTLEKIGQSAFYNCKAIDSIDLDTTKVTTIEKNAFRNCISITELVFDDKIEKIDDLAFYGCVNILSINLPDSLTYLGKKAFYNALEVKELTIGSALTKIPESAFYGASKLKVVNIPDNIISIGRKAFQNCEALETINFGSNIEEISDYSFYNCKNVSKLEFNDKLKTIGNYAFKGLENLKVLNLSKNINFIGQHSFYGCKNLTIYTDAESILPNWHERFNSSRRPLFYNVEYDDEGKVKSVMISSTTLFNKNATGGISNPSDNFKHWVDENQNIYNMDDLLTITSDMKLYAVYE